MPVRPSRAIAGATALGATVLLAACGSSGGGPGSGDGSTPTSPAAQSATSSSSGASSPQAAGQTVTATLTEFHIALDRTRLTPGTYTFSVKNAGRITHALTVDGKGVEDKGTGDLAPGATGTVTVTLAAGSYDVYCPVGDHKMEGMDVHVTVA